MAEPLWNLEQYTPFAFDLDHPECVAWGPDGYVYAGGEAGQIYRVTLDDGKLEEIARTGTFMCGFCLDADANVYGLDMGRQEVVRVTPSGDISTYSNGSADRKMMVPNYPVFDASGTLYVSDSGDWGQLNGCIFAIHPGGETFVFNDEPQGFTNGMALSPDGSQLYFIESSPPKVRKVSINPDGSSGKAQMVVELPRTVPDGLAFDREGNLYISCYNPHVIYRLTPAGKLDLLLDDWEAMVLYSPTNVAFGGPGLSTLLIASLAGTWLTKGPAPVAGSPLHYPKL